MFLEFIICIDKIVKNENKFKAFAIELQAFSFILLLIIQHRNANLLHFTQLYSADSNMELLQLCLQLIVQASQHHEIREGGIGDLKTSV